MPGNQYSTDKIFKIGDSIVGVAGEVALTCAFLSWFRRECPAGEMMGVDDEEAGFGALVLNSRGLFYYSNCCDPDRIHDPFYAIGSGGNAAIAAMMCGKSPHDAVRIASKIDPSTGGAIKVLALEQTRRKKTPTPLPPAGAQTDAPTREGKI